MAAGLKASIQAWPARMRVATVKGMEKRPAIGAAGARSARLAAEAKVATSMPAMAAGSIGPSASSSSIASSAPWVSRQQLACFRKLSRMNQRVDEAS